MPRMSKAEGIVEKLKACDEGTRYYFWMLEELIRKVSRPEPALAYCFQRIESAQRVALYALLMRKYRTDSQLAWEAIDRLDITRTNFPAFYHVLSGRKFPKELRDILSPAEAVRDRITHGKVSKTGTVLTAIGTCLDYAEALNAKVWTDAGFRPFGQLRGVTSSSRPQLEKEISRLVIRGLGLENAKTPPALAEN